MDITNNNSEKIDAYLLGQLKGQERLEFEAELSKDIRLQEEVTLQQQIMKGLATYGNQQLRGRLSRIREEQKQQKTIGVLPRRRIFRYVAAAAAIALLLITLTILWNNTASTDVFSDNYKPYNLTAGSRTTDGDARIATISQWYNAGDYAKALPALEAYLSEHPNNAKLQLAAAISHIELQQEAAAIAYFDTILDSADPFFTDHARWYKALCFIKLDRAVEAKALLQLLANDKDADHHQEAKDLLEDM